MQNAIRRYDTLPGPNRRFSLFDISQSMGVPVVIANYRGADNLPTNATYGLDMDVNWAQFARAIDQLCEGGAVIVANIEGHEKLGRLAQPLLARDLRFFVGVPIRDYQARKIGSIAVLATQTFVARRGISVSRLGQLGRQLTGFSF